MSIRPELQRVAREHYPDCRLESLVGDASTRQFHRLHRTGEASLVVMDYGKPFEGITDDVRLARIFSAAGLPVAAIEQIWPDSGCLLLEDLGDDLLEGQLGTASREEGLALLGSAVDLAVDIAHRGTPVLAASKRAAGPALDAERFRFEMDYFLEHFAGSLRKRPVSRGLQEALHTLADTAAAGPRVLCHRDYHSRNLMVRPDGGLAMVDIQDARWGPDSYDLASLLRDAYIDLPEEWVEAMIDRHLARLASCGSPLDAASFRNRFHITSAQRMIKALGTFGYQVGVLSRERYRNGIPRTLGRLQRVLPRDPSTAQLARLLDEAGLLAH